MHKLVATLLLLLPLTLAAQAQEVSVGAYHGFADATTQRVLVSVDTPEAAAQLPATVTLDGAPYSVQATTLPLLRLDHADVVATAFAPGTLVLVDPQADATSAVSHYNVELRYRGATALAYDKKSYALKLLASAPATEGDAAESLDAALLGMRSDNSWILDAMASDVSRMRNRASTDLWLDFSRPPYYADQEPALSNGTHGRFVELFVADRYWGLYCLTEKIDRKQLRVKKHKGGTPRGIIYKSFTYDNMSIISDPTPSNTSYTWQGWEGAYPDVRRGEPFDWMPLLDLYTFLGQEVPSFDLLDHLHQRLDLPVWRDYVIFCDLLHADDNVAKNMYVYYRDVTEPVTFVTEHGKTETVPAPGPLSVCPWDLDATWGRDFMRQPIEPTDNCNVSNAPNKHLWLSQYDQGQSYYTRWAQLRQSLFTPDGLWAYFERYFDLFDTSGAARRETERWQDTNGVHLDFTAERNYIRRWIGYRLGYLDGDYNYTDAAVTHILATTPATPIPVVTPDGRTLTHVDPTTPIADLNLPPGLYIVGRRKVSIK